MTGVYGLAVILVICVIGGWGALSATQQQRAVCAFFAGKQPHDVL